MSWDFACSQPIVGEDGFDGSDGGRFTELTCAYASVGGRSGVLIRA